MLHQQHNCQKLLPTLKLCSSFNLVFVCLLQVLMPSCLTNEVYNSSAVIFNIYSFIQAS